MHPNGTTNFRIGWRHKIDGNQGAGTKRFAEAEARKLARELNVEHPKFQHWAEEVPQEVKC